MSIVYDTIYFKRGPEATMPNIANNGEPLWTTDTHRMFVGYGNGIKEIAGVEDLGYVTPEMFGGGVDKSAEINNIAIQAAIDTAGRAGVLMLGSVAHNDQDQWYNISETLTVPYQSFRIIGPPRSEFDTAIQMTVDNKDILLVTGFGFRMDNIMLRGFKGNYDETATAGDEYSGGIGLVVDRSSLKTDNPDRSDETYSNIDADIYNCGFLYLDTGIKIVGRNMIARNNIFTVNRVGVKIEIATYQNGAAISEAECRGFQIQNNRFHSNGYPTYLNHVTNVDTWCIDAPTESSNYFNAMISGNMADFGAGFYRGSLASVTVTDNQCHVCSGLLVDTGLTPATRIGDSRDGGTVNDNYYIGTAQIWEGQDYTFPDNAIRIMNHENVTIQGNTLKNVLKEAILIGTNTVGCNGMAVLDNVITNANFTYTTTGHTAHDGTDTAAITVFANGNGCVNGNVVRCTETAGGQVTSHAYALSLNNSNLSSVLSFHGNTLQAGRTGTVQTVTGGITGEDRNAAGQLIVYCNRHASSGTLDPAIILAHSDVTPHNSEPMVKMSATLQSLSSGGEKTDIVFHNMQTGTLTPTVTFPWTGGITTTGQLTTGNRTRHLVMAADVRGNPAATPALEAIGTAPAMVFASTGTEYAYFQWEVPSDWVPGTNVFVEVDWTPWSASMGAGDAVKWDVVYGCRAEGEAVNGSLTTASVTITGAAITQYVTTHSPTTIASNDATNPLTHEDHVFFRVSRDTGVANDFAGTVGVLAFELLYTSNGIPEG